MRDFFIGLAIMCVSPFILVLFIQNLPPTYAEHEDLTPIYAFFAIIFFSILPFAIYQWRKQSKIWKNFSRMHGYVFGSTSDISCRSRFIKGGREPEAVEPMSRRYGSGTIVFYDCNVAHGGFPDAKSPTGKSDFFIRFTTSEITVPHQFKEVFLKSKKQGYPDTAWGMDLSGMEPMTLEGNFDTYFSVWGEQYQASDALLFLTPDVMENLIKYGADFDIEVAANKFFVYSSRVERSPERLEAMNTLSEYLVGLCGKQDGSA